MKRALTGILQDSRDLEEDEILRAEVVRSDAQQRYAAAEEKAQASRVAAVNDTIEKWDAMGLQSAAGCTVTSPNSLPRVGSCPFFLLFPPQHAPRPFMILA